LVAFPFSPSPPRTRPLRFYPPFPSTPTYAQTDLWEACFPPPLTPPPPPSLTGAATFDGVPSIRRHHRATPWSFSRSHLFFFLLSRTKLMFSPLTKNSSERRLPQTFQVFRPQHSSQIRCSPYCSLFFPGPKLHLECVRWAQKASLPFPPTSAVTNLFLVCLFPPPFFVTVVPQPELQATPILLLPHRLPPTPLVHPLRLFLPLQLPHRPAPFVFFLG